MTTAYLALGSNTGDRLANLRQTVALLEAQPEIVVDAKSRIYETQSVEGGGEGDFLNAALRIRTALSPEDLLAITNGIEEKLGRPQPPRHGPRSIDIDILSYGDVRMDGEDLTLPHPRQHHRAFVLKPLVDVLEGGWVEETGLEW